MNRYLLMLLCYFIILSQNEMGNGKKAFEEKKYEKAIKLFKAVLDDDDENKEAWFYLGKSYYFIKDYEEAVDSFDEAIDDKTTHIDYLKWYAKANQNYVNEASFFSKMSIAKSIVSTYRRILKIDPNQMDTEIELVGFLLNAPAIAGGDVEEAFKRLKRLKGKAPFQANRLLFKYYMKEGKISEAENCLKEIEQAKDKVGNYYTVYNDLGYYYLSKKNPQKAVQAFLKQAKLASNSANSYDSLGDGYKALGDIPKAKEAYKKAIKLNPNFEASIKNLKDLEK